jgi:hypothetical protein
MGPWCRPPHSRNPFLSWAALLISSACSVSLGPGLVKHLSAQAVANHANLTANPWLLQQPRRTSSYKYQSCIPISPHPSRSNTSGTVRTTREVLLLRACRASSAQREEPSLWAAAAMPAWQWRVCSCPCAVEGNLHEHCQPGAASMHLGVRSSCFLVGIGQYKCRAWPQIYSPARRNWW